MIQIDIDKCIGCKACEKDCPGRAIKVTDGKAEYVKKCILCGHCVAICPQNAVSIPDYDMEDMEEYDPQTFHVDPKAFLHAVKFRRSIRNFTEKPIPQTHSGTDSKRRTLYCHCQKQPGLPVYSCAEPSGRIPDSGLAGDAGHSGASERDGPFLALSVFPFL